MAPDAPTGFEHLAALVRDALPAQDLLTVLGGEERFSVETARQLIGAWRSQQGLEWAVWEFFSKLHPPARSAEIPPSESWEYFQRARLFGDGGDLQVRRDEDRLFWSLVGPPGLEAPAGIRRVRWSSAERLVCRERSALLWGERGAGQESWFESRVGAADLAYGAEPGWERVALRFREYSCGGAVQHVWWLRLQQWEPGR